MQYEYRLRCNKKLYGSTTERCVLTILTSCQLRLVRSSRFDKCFYHGRGSDRFDKVAVVSTTVQPTSSQATLDLIQFESGIMMCCVTTRLQILLCLDGQMQRRHVVVWLYAY